MGRTLIAAVVGMIILFAYQALSWTVLPTHKDALRYTPDQDAIITCLSQHLKEDAVYGIPTAAPGEEMGKSRHIGKPWAMIQYHNAWDADWVPHMVIGFILAFLSALLVSIVLSSTNTSLTTFMSRYLVVIGFGIFIVLQAKLMEWNWFDTPSNYLMGEIIDPLVSWALCGIWLAAFLKNRRKAA